MIKRFLLPVLIITILFAPATVSAQDKITVLDRSAQVYFPSALVFNIAAESSSDITKARLHYQVDKMNYAQVTSEGWPPFTPSTKMKAQWVWDMRKSSLPAGAAVRYWWTLQDRAGNELATTIEKVRFDDLRYSWQTLTAGQLNLLWYEGGQTFAGQLMGASQEALDRLAQNTGVRLERPATIYIYASSKDLQGAMIFPREWTGGAAFSEYGIISIGVALNQLEWGKRALAHELGHLVTHQITFSPYGANLPTWLDEGLAMYAEGAPDPYLENVLQKAVSEKKLFSVRSLSSPFSAKADEAYISYAQSQSLVEFLLGDFPRDNMLRLLTLSKEGTNFDRALTDVYGFDQDGLGRSWLETLTASVPSLTPSRTQAETERLRLPAMAHSAASTPVLALLNDRGDVVNIACRD